MKTKKRFFILTVVLLVAYILSACGPAQEDERPSTGEQSGEQTSIKVRASEVAFTGVVEAINGNDWTIGGQVLTIDPAVVRDGPFQAGDTVKIEGNVNQDGSITITRVEAPSAEDLANLPHLGNDNTNENANENANDNANSNDANSNSNANLNTNDDNSNDDANSNVNDDNSNDDDDSNSNDDNSNDDDSNSNDDDSSDDHSGSGSGSGGGDDSDDKDDDD